MSTKLIVKSDPFSSLAHRVQRAREDERERMARDLHDSMGMSLAALKFESERLTHSLDQKLASSPDVDIARIFQRVRLMNTLIDEALEAKSDLVRDHHPRLLRERGLRAALENHACRFSRRTGISCTLSNHQDIPDPEPAVALELFRSFQEALTNVQRHAHASKLLVKLMDTPSHTLLEIVDNGRGFRSPQRTDSYGLSNIRERMRMVGGTCDIDSQPGQGTRLRLCVPRLVLGQASEQRYSS